MSGQCLARDAHLTRVSRCRHLRALSARLDFLNSLSGRCLDNVRPLSGAGRARDTRVCRPPFSRVFLPDYTRLSHVVRDFN